jgi:hypothetical protein
MWPNPAWHLIKQGARALYPLAHYNFAPEKTFLNYVKSYFRARILVAFKLDKLLEN